MFLDPEIPIAGYPAKRIRDFFRRSMDMHWSIVHIIESLDLDRRRAGRLLDDLQELGLVEFYRRSGEYDFYGLTSTGRRIGLATLAKPLRRETAEKKLEEFLARVHQVNADDYFVYQVERVVLFGSMLTNAARPSDIDLSIKLCCRFDGQEHEDRFDARIREALGGGRRFSGILSEVGWPYTEVLLFLKSRSRALSLHDYDATAFEDTEHRVIFERGPGRR